MGKLIRIHTGYFWDTRSVATPSGLVIQPMPSEDFVRVGWPHDGSEEHQSLGTSKRDVQLVTLI